MSKLSYLIFAILCAILSHQILGLSNENDESSSLLPHRRQKRMDHNLNQNQPRGIPELGVSANIRVVNLEEPTEVEIIALNNPSHLGYLINRYFVVTRPKYVPTSSFRIRLTVGRQSLESEEWKTFIDYSQDVAVIGLTEGLSFSRPEKHALEKQGYTDAAILYALGIVHNRLQHEFNYEVQVIGSKWQAAAESLNSRSRHEPTCQNQHRVIPRLNEIEDLNVVDIEEPTRVDIISPGMRPCPGFAIHHFFVVTRPRCVEGGKNFRIKLTVGDKSVEYKADKTYEKNYIAVVKVKKPIALSNPVHNAFYYEGYRQATIDYAVGIVEEWIESQGHTMRLTGTRRVGGYESDV